MKKIITKTSMKHEKELVKAARKRDAMLAQYKESREFICPECGKKDADNFVTFNIIKEDYKCVDCGCEWKVYKFDELFANRAQKEEE